MLHHGGTPCAPRLVTCVLLGAVLGSTVLRAEDGASHPSADGRSATQGSPITSAVDDGCNGHPKLHPALIRLLADRAVGESVKVWVFFKDKGNTSDAANEAVLAALSATYNGRAIERRRARRTRPGLFDADDLPVHQSYVDAVEATGARVHVISRWLNGLSARATRGQLENISDLPFVKMVQPVRGGRGVEPVSAPQTGAERDADGAMFMPGRLDYGLAAAQLTQINLTAVHDLGFTGDGVIIGILDSGFEKYHVAFNHADKPLTVIAEWDFVNNDPNVGYEAGDYPTQHYHGTKVLGVIAAYAPGAYIGGAFDASFILCKTEDDADEYPEEEDNWVAGLEFIEANGGDLATSSLGYIDWYTQRDADGMTAVTTIALNIASQNGVHSCKSTGNGGHDANPVTSHLDFPADAFKVVSCGAVDLNGVISASSSDGPTADKRVKPEVLARGVATQTVSPTSPDTYLGANGTSFSAPLVASAVACLIQAHPTWTVDRMRSHLFHTADFFVANGTFEPTYVRGYGIIDALAALAGDCNANGIDDETDIAGETSEDCNGNGVPDECDMDSAGDYTTDCNANGELDDCEEDCNSNSVPDECDIAEGTSMDVNQDGIPDECALPVETPLPENSLGITDCTIDEDCAYQANCVDGTCYAPKHRYISIARNPEQVLYTARRITLEGGGADPWWVGAPYQAVGLDIADVVDEPVYADHDFTGDWPDLVNVTGCQIAPDQTYLVQAIPMGAEITEEANYSTAIALHTPEVWGDVISTCVNHSCQPPEGEANIDDILAGIAGFQSLNNDPLTWFDIAPALGDGVPNQMVDIDDILANIQGFQSKTYPGNGPLNCP